MLRGFMLRVNPSGRKTWYVQLDRSRKRKIDDAAVLNAAVARHRAADLLARAARLAKAAGGRPEQTLGEFLAGPYPRWCGIRHRFAERDAQRLRAAIGPLAETPLSQIGLSQIERWRLKRGKQVSDGTLRRELAALKSALNRAFEWRLIRENPASRVVPMPTAPEPETRVLTEGERRRLLDSLDRRDDRIATMVLLALNCGLSRGELFRLRWRDVHFGVHASIQVRKAARQQNASRRVPLNAAAATALENWKSSRARTGALVFPAPSGGPLKSIATAWSKLLDEAEIRNFRFRDCRHDFAARLVRAGMPLSGVKELLGHSSIGLTERYAEFAPDPGRAIIDRIAVS